MQGSQYPTHAASLPICIIPNCAATRHVHFTLDGSGPAYLEAPSIDAYPDIAWETGDSVRRVNLDTETADDVNPGGREKRSCSAASC